MDDLDSAAFEELLTAVGEHLAAAGERASIVVVGGSAMSMMGWVDRTTQDVDVIARAREPGDGVARGRSCRPSRCRTRSSRRSSVWPTTTGCARTG